MKTLSKLLIGSAIASAVIFGGCASKGAQSMVSSEANLNDEFKDAPAWVLMPVVEGSVSSVGSAAKNAGNDISFQRNEAMADARDNIARQIEVSVGNMFKSFKSSTGAGKDGTFDKAVESVSKQIANQTLRGTVQKGVWISRSGTMYVLVAIDTKSVIAAANENAKTSFKNDEAMYQKFLAQKAQEELAFELEKSGQK